MKQNKTLKRWLAILCVLVLCISVPLGALAKEEKQQMKAPKQLQFNEDGKFKILVLADLQDTNLPRPETIELAETAIQKTQPDFIALLGDNIAGWWKGVTPEETKQAIDAFCKVIDDTGIPFAFVYGNHDHEGLCDEENGMNEEEAKELMLSWYQNYKTCMAVEGEEMTGVGNYNLPILSSDGSKTAFNLWFMDSNPYTPEEEGGGYGYVHEDQTAWYKKTSDALKAENGGEPVPSIVFQHIIVPEAYDMFNKVSMTTKGAVRGHRSFSDNYYVPNPEYVYEGLLNEGPCPPDTNHGQFQSWIDQGDVVAGVFGHDHSNSFAGLYKGIHLVAAPGVTYYSYGNNHGVRTITIDENNPTEFKSEILTYEAVTGHEVKNIYVRNHGYYEFKHNFIPALCGAIGGVVVLAVGIPLIVKNVKKRKQK